MALAATMVFEVRTTGNDLNSGAFNSAAAGTDYSIIDPAQHTGADLTMHAVTNTDVLPVVAGVGADDVGNSVRISAGTGWTPGLYEIKSQDGTYWRLDRSPSAAGNLNLGTYRMGGSLLSPALACAAAIGSNKIWIQGGTYSVTSSSSNVVGGRMAVNVTRGEVEGYETNRGDKGTRPIILAATTAVYSLASTGGSSVGTRYINLIFDGDSRTGVLGMNVGSSFGTAISCKAQHCPAGGFKGTGTALWVDCHAHECGTRGFDSTGSTMMMWVNCMAEGQVTGGGFSSAGGGVAMGFGCVAANNAAADAAGFLLTGGGIGSGFYHCIAYGNDGHGFDVQNAISQGPFVNCMAYDNGDVDFNTDQAVTNTTIVNCAGEDTPAMLGPTIGSVTLTADPFTDGPNLDFTLNDAAGGGALCKKLGYPAFVPGTAFPAEWDIGLQTPVSTYGFPHYGELTGGK